MNARPRLAPVAEAAPCFESFRDAHRGETILVCGCGESLNTLPLPTGCVTIGVNDVGRRFHPDYLVVVNPRSQFAGDRFHYVETSQARALFTQLDLPVRHPQVVRFRLGQNGGTDFDRPDALHFTQNSPYLAVCLAVHMGAKRIGLIGVDFTEHHFFARTGTHPLSRQFATIDSQYRRLSAALQKLGIEVVNLSRTSRLTALPKMDVADFLAPAKSESPAMSAVPAQSPRPKVFVVNYRFFSCGDVFSDGLRQAAAELAYAYQESWWDDPQLPAKIDRFRPDLVFVVHGRRFVQRWGNRFHRYNSAVWLVDEPYEVDDTATWSHNFKTVFINDPATLQRHRNAHYLPVCFDPRIHRQDGQIRRYKVGFIGGFNATRERYLLALAEAGLLGYVVGGPWQAPGLRKLSLAANIPPQRAAELYQQTEIVLNVFRETHHYNRHAIAAFSINPRIYEAIACGAAVVSERRAELPGLFPDIPQFDTPEELVSTIRALIADPDQLARIRAGSQALLTGHAYSDRLRQVVQITHRGERTSSMTMVESRETISAVPVIAGWQDCGAIERRSEGGIVNLTKPQDDAGGTETGLISENSFSDVELSFDIRLAQRTSFIAKVHLQDQHDQAANSYHLVLTAQQSYVARHFHIFRTMAAQQPGIWRRITLRRTAQELAVLIDGVPHLRQADNLLRSGYCFLGINAGCAELRNIQLRALTARAGRPSQPRRVPVPAGRPAIAPRLLLAPARREPYARSHPPMASKPRSFSAPLIRNLIYHVWPVRGTTWRWNLDQLKQRIDLFNGRRLVGIVHDGRSESPDAVREYLEGHGCEFVVAANDQRGEAITFPSLLEAVASQNPDELTFYAHAKGVKYEPSFPPNVRKWAEVQYRVMLDDWSSVKNAMERFAMTGILRAVGRFGAHRHMTDWHYSGAFFWMRHAQVFSRQYRDVPQFYGGVEIWPGLMFRKHETGCLLLDNLKQPPYHDVFWRNTGDAAFRQWESRIRPVAAPPDLVAPVPLDGHDWPRLEQKPDEFSWWIQQLLAHDVRRLLTIGCMCGGVEWHIARVFRQHGRRIDITAIDLGDRKELRETFQDARTRFDQSLALITGDSRSSQVRQQLAGPYDAVFIDGDHGYSGARKDFELAQSLRPKLIGFHDIVDSDWHAANRCCVSRLWREVAQQHKTEARTSGDWGGIGVVKLA